MAPVPKTTTQSAAPLLKNASAAPIVYFDNVPLYGSFSGNIEIEIGVRVLMPKPDGKVAVENNCVAHLRCSPPAASVLIDALQKGLALYAKQQQDAANEFREPDDMNGTHLNS
jgi:hypothetical protein